jgi:hypothetical protein
MAVYKNRHNYSAVNDVDIYVEDDGGVIMLTQKCMEERTSSMDMICVESLEDCNKLIEYLNHFKEKVFKNYCLDSLE